MQIQYFVNKEKRTVVCKLSDCHKSLSYSLCKRNLPGAHVINMKNEFIGKAVCHPKDKFDETTGRRIAYHKAIIKFEHNKRYVLKFYCDEMEKLYKKMVRDTKELSIKSKMREFSSIAALKNIHETFDKTTV